MKLTKEISDAIRTYRAAKRLSQTEFGDQVGVKQSQVARWESMDAKSIPYETWEALYPYIKDLVSVEYKATKSIPTATPERELPLPIVFMEENTFTNYNRREADRVFTYGESDMQPAIPQGSQLLVDTYENPLELPEEYVALDEMRILIPDKTLVVSRWDHGEGEPFQIRRVKYKQVQGINGKPDWYEMYLCRDTVPDQQCLRVKKGDQVKFFGQVKALVKIKVSKTGFVD